MAKPLLVLASNSPRRRELLALGGSMMAMVRGTNEEIIKLDADERPDKRIQDRRNDSEKGFLGHFPKKNRVHIVPIGYPRFFASQSKVPGELIKTGLA